MAIQHNVAVTSRDRQKTIQAVAGFFKIRSRSPSRGVSIVRIERFAGSLCLRFWFSSTCTMMTWCLKKINLNRLRGRLGARLVDRGRDPTTSFKAFEKR